MSSRGRSQNEKTQSEIVFYRDHFQDIVQHGKLVSSNSTIFIQLANDLKKTPKAVYLTVKRNFNAIFPECATETSNQQDESSTSHETSIDDDNNKNKSDGKGVVSFEIKIEADMFPLEYYAKKQRQTQIVRQRPKTGWSDKLFQLVWREKKVMCAWTFRHTYVRVDDSIVFEGFCTECNAVFRGVTNTSHSMLFVKVSGYDENYNHIKRRRIVGENRAKIVDRLKHKSAFKVHRDLANELIDKDENRPPDLPNLSTLRQIKYVSSIEDGKGAVQNILKWKNSSAAYRNDINDVGCSPFFVFYQLPIQREWYIKESQNNNHKMAISVGATGSIVKPPEDSEIASTNQKLKHVFLYNIMAKTKSTSVPINQMISQRHTARFISYWFDQTFENLPPPCEVVCDDSRALLLALVKSFTNYKSVKDYIRARKKSVEQHCSPPNCYIRLDRSHFVNNIVRKIAGKDVRKRNFYRSIFGYLIQCDNFQEAKDIILNLFTVMLNKFAGTNRDSMQLPAEMSKKKLLDLCWTHIHEFDSDQNQDSEKDSDYGELDDEWLQKIIASVPIANEETQTDLIENAYYCEYDKEKLLLTIPLWSNIMKNVFDSRYETATSQDVESNFKTVKYHVLDQKMVRVFWIRKWYKFLKLHLNYLKTEYQIRKINEQTENKAKKKKTSSKLTITEAPRKTKRSASLEDLSPKMQHIPGKRLKSNSFHDHDSSNSIEYETAFTSSLPDIGTHSKQNSNCISSQKCVTYSALHSPHYTEDKFVYDQKNQNDMEAIHSHQFNPVLELTRVTNEDTNMQCEENWRGKNLTTALHTHNQRRSKYSILNKCIPVSKAILMLKNGNRSYHGRARTVYTYNTCSFVSVFQIFAALYNDYESIKIQIDANETSEFCAMIKFALGINFEKNRKMIVPKNLYTKRDSILEQVYARKKVLTTTGLLSINCASNISYTIEHVLPKELFSYTRQKKCPICKNSIVSNRAFIDINITEFANESVRIHDLNEHIKNELLSEDISSKCSQKSCIGMFKIETTYFQLIMIDLQLICWKDNKRFSINEAPQELRLSGITFKIMALIEFIRDDETVLVDGKEVMGHYISHIRRCNDQWESYDDLSNKINTPHCSRRMEVHTLFYVQNE